MKIFVDACPTRICFSEDTPRKFQIIHIESMPNIHCAEFLAIIVAMKNTRGNLDIYSDSKIIVDFINHQSNNVTHPRFGEMLKQFNALKFGRIVNVHWIPRERNKAGKRLQIVKAGFKKWIKSSDFTNNFEMAVK